MEKIEFKVSELTEFSKIMRLQDEQWLGSFKDWFKSTIKDYYWANSLFLLSQEDHPERFHDMHVNELASALFDTNYPKFLGLVVYDENKLSWWNKVVYEYEQEFFLYEKLRAKGIKYVITHCSLFKKISKQLDEKNCTLTAVEIVEIALCRYLQEEKGDYNNFLNFMK